MLKSCAPATLSVLRGDVLRPAHFYTDSVHQYLRSLAQEGRELVYVRPTVQSAWSACDQASRLGLGRGHFSQLAAWWPKDDKV
jgi:hypothetical protein